MRIQPVIDHLRAAGTGFLDIGGAAELAEISERIPPRLPALFIVPVRETRRGGRTTGPSLRQQVSYEFSAIAVIHNAAGAAGLAGNEALHTLRQQLIAAMVALDHPDGSNRPIPAGWQLVEVTDRILISDDAFVFDGADTHDLS